MTTGTFMYYCLIQFKNYYKEFKYFFGSIIPNVKYAHTGIPLGTRSNDDLINMKAGQLID